MQAGSYKFIPMLNNAYLHWNKAKRWNIMANRPQKYCSAYPCNRLVEADGYCAEHKPKPALRERDPFYHTNRWRRYSEWFRAKYPVCAHCLQKGITTPADVVDHIIELKDGGAQLRVENTESLCHAHHNAKSLKERMKRGPKVYSYWKNHQLPEIHERRGSQTYS